MHKLLQAVGTRRTGSESQDALVPHRVLVVLAPGIAQSAADAPVEDDTRLWDAAAAGAGVGVEQEAGTTEVWQNMRRTAEVTLCTAHGLHHVGQLVR